jgi:hypothetical protein
VIRRTLVEGWGMGVMQSMAASFPRKVRRVIAREEAKRMWRERGNDG